MGGLTSIKSKNFSSTVFFPKFVVYNYKEMQISLVENFSPAIIHVLMGNPCVI